MNNHVAEADPRYPYKAYVSAAFTALAVFVSYYLADKAPFTGRDAAEALIAAVLASGLTGLGTFTVRNPKIGEKRRG